MTRTQLNARIPESERDAIRASAKAYGISMSAYLRILAIQDRENQEREQLRQQMYPDKPRPLDT